MLDVLIFSKDRPGQLDLLLRSIEREFVEWREAHIAILYTFESAALRYGYDLVRAAHPEISFVCERDFQQPFKPLTLSLLGGNPYTMFLVDDIVLKEPFTTAAPEMARFMDDPSIMFASLRMDPGMTYVYTVDRTVQPPEFLEGNVWDWTASEGDWGYPMSLDGHIFRTKSILPLLAELDFHDPNSLEFALSKRPLPNPHGVCFDVAKLINLPLNRVQSTAPNRHGGGDARALNARFLRGQRLSLRTVEGVRPRAPHEELPVIWEPWPADASRASRIMMLRAALEATSSALSGAAMSALRPMRRAAGRVRRTTRNRLAGATGEGNS